MLEIIIEKNLLFLLGNKIGFFIPLLVSLFLAHKYNVLKSITPDILIIFFLSVIVSVPLAEHRVEIIGDRHVESLISRDYFAAIYLFWHGLYYKKYDFNIPLLFCGVFYSGLLLDLLFIVFIKKESIFNESIGGAGIYDGLFLTPIFVCTCVYILRTMIKYKLESDEAIRSS